MASFLFLLIFLVAALIAWIIIKPAWAPKPPDNETTEKLTQQVFQTYQATRDALGKIKLPLSNSKKESISFQSWLLTLSSSKPANMPKLQKDMAAWIENMDPKQSQSFYVDLAAFFKSSGYNLDWLVNEELSDEYQQAMQESAILYCLARWRQQKLVNWAAYQEWKTAPEKNKAYGIKLIRHLVENDLVSLSPDLVMSDEKERVSQLIQSVEAARQQSPKGFNDALAKATEAPPKETIQPASEPPTESSG